MTSHKLWNWPKEIETQFSTLRPDLKVRNSAATHTHTLTHTLTHTHTHTSITGTRGSCAHIFRLRWARLSREVVIRNSFSLSLSLECKLRRTTNECVSVSNVEASPSWEFGKSLFFPTLEEMIMMGRDRSTSCCYNGHHIALWHQISML